MKYLLDTHVLIWAAGDKLPKSAIGYFSEENELYFSPISIWEIVIKNVQGREEFQIDPKEFYMGLRKAGYKELHVTAKHSLAVGSLPGIHKDPFDRMLLSQAITENLELITADKRLAKYPAGTIII